MPTSPRQNAPDETLRSGIGANAPSASLGSRSRPSANRFTLTVVALILVLAGCGGSDSESSGTSETTATVEATLTTTATTQRVVSNDPLACLEEAGLTNVEERDVDVWRGDHAEAPYAITIHKLATPAEPPTVVAGTYAVTGPFKVAAEGEGLSNEEGLLADALVQEVATCLGG
jgi:hypothetical protein